MARASTGLNMTTWQISGIGMPSLASPNAEMQKAKGLEQTSATEYVLHEDDGKLRWTLTTVVILVFTRETLCKGKQPDRLPEPEIWYNLMILLPALPSVSAWLRESSQSEPRRGTRRQRPAAAPSSAWPLAKDGCRGLCWCSAFVTGLIRRCQDIGYARLDKGAWQLPSNARATFVQAEVGLPKVKNSGFGKATATAIGCSGRGNPRTSPTSASGALLQLLPADALLIAQPASGWECASSLRLRKIIKNGVCGQDSAAAALLPFLR